MLVGLPAVAASAAVMPATQVLANGWLLVNAEHCMEHWVIGRCNVNKFVEHRIGHVPVLNIVPSTMLNIAMFIVLTITRCQMLR